METVTRGETEAMVTTMDTKPDRIRLARVIDAPPLQLTGSVRCAVTFGDLPAGHYVRVTSHGRIVAHVFALEFDSPNE
jgi:hypothetical protein